MRSLSIDSLENSRLYLRSADFEYGVTEHLSTFLHAHSLQLQGFGYNVCDKSVPLSLFPSGVVPLSYKYLPQSILVIMSHS
jgi:hypothetical protein